MRKGLVLSGLVVVVGVIAIQFVPIDTANPPVEQDIPASPELKAVLQRACYNCHSNETEWPWYSRFAPISWLLAWDVHEGRAELNYSTWNRYDSQQQVKKLEESWKDITEGEMPPWYYLPIHREAHLSPDDRALLRQWTLQP
jgi:hypothetical protein